VGRLRPSLREAADEYQRRLAAYLKPAEIEVREAGRAPTPEAARRLEAERLRARLESGWHLVALDREGPAWSSERLADRMARWRNAGRGVGLLLGGSHGLDRALLEQCAERWSFGPLTLPHELARVVAYEQLYRACTILRGEPYHK
jgi:23S rRNA (pseudouridine1915-N3)-methyltransferase